MSTVIAIQEKQKMSAEEYLRLERETLREKGGWLIFTCPTSASQNKEQCHDLRNKSDEFFKLQKLPLS